MYYCVEMIKDENTDGVSTWNALNLCGLTCGLTTRRIVEGPAVRDLHVLTYDDQHSRFRFDSRSMYHATKKYLNEQKKLSWTLIQNRLLDVTICNILF